MSAKLLCAELIHRIEACDDAAWWRTVRELIDKLNKSAGTSVVEIVQLKQRGPAPEALAGAQRRLDEAKSTTALTMARSFDPWTGKRRSTILMPTIRPSAIDDIGVAGIDFWVSSWVKESPDTK